MDRVALADSDAGNDSRTSGVSWPAIAAGAFVTAALSLALLTLGTGIGLSAVSPWANSGASASAIGWSAVLWLVILEITASAMGGYLTGRLRTRWVSVHTHEVYFRDTAHGFLVWAVSLVITAAFLASAAASVVGGSSRSSAPATASQLREASGPHAYFVDTLLRTPEPAASQNVSALQTEVAVIFSNGLREGGLPPADKSYLTRVVTARTGVSQSEAAKRVDDVFAQAQQAADQARKAVAHSMYWTFLALLVGAFSASFAATIGGRQRDRVATI